MSDQDDFYTEVGRRALSVLSRAKAGKWSEKMAEAVFEDAEFGFLILDMIRAADKERKKRNTDVELVLAAEALLVGLMAGSMTARAICEERQLAAMMEADNAR